MENHDENSGKIAIVGMDCRLPQANDIHEFWKNLVEEKECLTDFTEEELKAAGVSSKHYKNPDYVRRRGVVKDAEQFDAEFFNFTPREAELLDPQHRLFLECAWHALEDSGLDPFTTKKRVAVFGGTGSPYHLVDTIENESVLKYANGTSIITSNDKDYVTTRVSYKLNLKGPSINVQSACSTSMVGVVLGIDSLLNFQSDVVLAGGATIELPVTKGYMYQQGSLESPDGKCRTFDKDAQGTVFSRGCGVVALKRLEDAIEDGDHIYSVILGGAVNNDGNRKAGYTAPSVQGQVEVITEAIELSGINPRTISMVEAHGTATSVGDPIEVSSLTEAFQQYTNEKQFCAIGSVKTNIGHTDVASGVASFIKTCMSLKHGFVPASLNYNESNPAIHFEDSPFYVNTKTSKWEASNGTPRRALINSFGVGGTNACVILEEPPKQKKPNQSHAYDTLLLSAHNKTSFEMYCKAIVDKIKNESELHLNALAHTSRVARKAMKYRASFAFKEKEDLLEKLKKSSAVKQNTLEDKGFVMMFPGQGNQFVNMGRELYDTIPQFKETIDYCASLLEPTIGLDIRKVIFPDEATLEESKELIDYTYITQPAIFMISYALANTLRQYGVQPNTLIGHSVGEYVAAAVSGIMTLEDALTAVAVRGKLVYDLPKGSMLAVLMSEEKLLEILPDTLNIAVINSPELVVVSGETEHIEAFAQQLKADKVFNKLLPTSHAFHSKMMEPCLAPYRDFFKEIKLNAPKIPVISTVTGALLTDEEAQNHEYWVQHVIDPVRFGDAAAQMLAKESTLFFECGPGQSLESAVKRQLDKENHHSVIATLYEGTDAVIAMDNAMGKLWIEDISVLFEQRYDVSGYAKVPFPLLPFHRKPYMVDFSTNKPKVTALENTKKEYIEDWYYAPSWKKTAAIDFLKSNKETTDTETVWILFLESEFSKIIAAALQEKGYRFYTVEKGKAFTENGNNYTLRSSEKEDYKQLFATLGADKTPLNIIYTWSFDDRVEKEKMISYQNVENHLDNNFYALLYLEQGLIEAQCVKDIRIVSLVNDAFDVVGNGHVMPEKSLAVGPMRVLFKEHLGISTLLINIDTSTIAQHKNQLAKAVLKETFSETDETIISYTGLNRWTEIFEKINVPHNALDTVVKDNGVYVITGGAGGIGRVLSLLIAENAKNTTIVWTGRKPLPQREEWASLLADKQTKSNLKERLKTIQKIEELGSRVAFYSVEVTDFEQMKTTLEDIECNYGTINGVVHSAGIAGGGVVASKQKHEIEQVLNPKVYGTLILKDLLKDKDLDFVSLFSSITAILGEAGRVDYISGNAFMDACANTSSWIHQNASTTSINWGQWGLIGMAADWQVESAQKKHEHNDTPLSHNVENHPITIDFLHMNEAESCYKINANAEDHWIFNEHLLTGMPTMVGTSYVDCLVKWKEKEGFTGALQLKDAVFLSPLMIMKNMHRELYLFCTKTGDNNFTFVFRSAGSSTSDMAEKDWKDHFEGKIVITDEKNEDKKDIQAIKERLPQHDNQPHSLVIRDGNNKATLQYSRRWDCKKEIYIGETEWLTALEMDAQFNDDYKFYSFHPAMMDVATSAHFRYMQTKASFLPYAYGEVHIYAPLEANCYCHTKLSETATDENYIAFDFQIYNPQGQLLIEVLHYTFVKIADLSNDKSSSNGSLQKTTAEALDDDILPDEGKRILQTLIGQSNLPQVVVYTKDLSIDFRDSKISFLRNEMDKKKKIVEVAADVDDRPDLDTPYEAPDNEIEKSIAAIWTVILGIHKIGLHDTFNSLGGNSLLAIQVVSGIKDEFNVEIATDEFVNNATVFKLAELVLEKIVLEHEADDIEMLLNE